MILRDLRHNADFQTERDGRQWWWWRYERPDGACLQVHVGDRRISLVGNGI